MKSTITAKPKNVPAKEWALACERAERAKQYAEKMPDFVRDSDLKFQSPMWQWENEVKGRMGDVVGGSLSGSRPNEIPV
jgi:predicted metal-dependent hydrolase